MSRWERPDRELPPFRLANLEGKVWNLEKLAGKTLVLNVWATWSAPCMLQLPFMQQLYDRFKDRKDVAVLTLNVDEDSHSLLEFLAGHSYTFPVLLGNVYVNQVVRFLSVPRLWIVDAKGKWQWEQEGFDAMDAGWIGDVEKRTSMVQEAAGG